MNIEQFESLPPSMIPGSISNNVSSANYRVRYFTADLSDLARLSMLEEILTKGLDGKEIVILEKDKYSFQNSYYVVITYLEKR